MPTLQAPGWLGHFPEKRRSLLANLFYQTVRAGSIEPLAIVMHVHRECHRRRQHSIDQAERDHWSYVLEVLRESPASSHDSCEQVVHNEQMPRAEREQQKTAAKKGYILRAMEGKPATPKQHAYLLKLGYQGALPEDKAAASVLIDQLLTEKHEPLFDKLGK